MSKSHSQVVALVCLVLALSVSSGCRQRRLPKRVGGKERTIVTMGGMILNDSRARPDVRFQDVAGTAGLRYTWHVEGKDAPNILQTIGNGCAFFDYDNDGNLDALLIGPHPALFHGDGKGNFVDVTSSMGLSELNGQFLGCAYGDVDGDGFDDVYISGYETGILLHNDAGKHFTDITNQAGLKPQPWGTSCAFGETIPGSGKLDIYIANYVVFGPKTDPQLCDAPSGEKIACGPEEYEPRRGVFYQNLGQSRFSDITQAAGFNTASGKGLGVAFANLDGSTRPQLLVENDGMAGDLFDITHDANGIHAKNLAIANGAAYDRDGNTHAGMGVDVGDYDNDGLLDVFVTTFADEPRSLYHNNGKNLFNDMGMSSGFPPIHKVAFGCKFLDFNNDGWLDLIEVNGHPQKNIEKTVFNSTYRQPCQLFRNATGVRPIFEDVSVSSPDLMKPIVGRGVAVGDYDNDGREDILVVDSDGGPLLFHNNCPDTGHWLGVRLVGTKSNKDGYGAMLTAKSGKHSYLRACQSSGSYFSASDKRVHFGIGTDKKVDKLTIKWPSGKVDTLKNLSVDRYITVVEGNPSPQ